METEFVSHWCPSCGGSSHPATGSAFSANYIVCYRCTLEFAAWVQRYTNARLARDGFIDKKRRVACQYTIKTTRKAREDARTAFRKSARSWLSRSAST